MEIEILAHGLELLVALLCFIALLPSSLNFKNLTKVYVLGSLLSFIVSKIYILEGPSYLVRDVVAWGNFVSISLVLSALFVIIRDSKPVFARFPIYLLCNKRHFRIYNAGWRCFSFTTIVLCEHYPF